MKKRLICIECPNGCELEVEVKNNQVMSVVGHKCDKGETYARQEVENPVRTLTSSVQTEGLAMKMVPVRTSKPIPKAALAEAMDLVKQIRLKQPLPVHGIVYQGFILPDVDLITTRSAT